MTRKEKRIEAEKKREGLRTMLAQAFRDAAKKNLAEGMKPSEAFHAAVNTTDDLAAKMIRTKPQEAEMVRGCVRDIGKRLAEEMEKVRAAEKDSA